MKKYKILISDYDETLINDQGEITQSSLEAINAFISRGGVFIINTGRVKACIQPLLKEYGLNCLLSTANGADLIDLKIGKEYYSHKIPVSLAVKAFSFFEKYEINAHAYIRDSVIISKVTDFSRKTEIRTKKKCELVKNVKEYIKKENVPLNKILIYEDADKLLKYDELLAKTLSEFEIIKACPNRYEITLKGITKATSVKMIANSLGVSTDDIIAVGDSGNDLAMLQAAGFSVAMGNASEQVKAVCDAVTDDNNHDGVRKLIEKYCI